MSSPINVEPLKMLFHEETPILALTPIHWVDYELIDCGNYEKLERYGSVTLIRPEPQAVWGKSLSDSEWQRIHDIRFEAKTPTSGNWIKKHKSIPDEWEIDYQNTWVQLKLKLALTAFKHIGVFPEQAANWDYMAATLKKFKAAQPRVLNLFAYTGGASLVARAMGAEVVHVDAIKQVVNWASYNQQLSGLDGIRWVVEDAVKFVSRELKRGRTYQGIILDPPAFGHGPRGERWKLDLHIQELVKAVIKLLDPQEHFLVLNMYSLGLSALIVENLIRTSYTNLKNLEVGELYMPTRLGSKLPLGVFGRFNS